jgi:hypothetical protein
MDAAEIRDRQSFEAWLNAWPEETRGQVARVLAHRAAMRAAPFLSDQDDIHRGSQTTVIKNAIWALTISSLAAFRASREVMRAALAADELYDEFIGDSYGIHGSARNASFASATDAAYILAAKMSLVSRATVAAENAASAASYADMPIGEMWGELSADAEQIESGESPLWVKEARLWKKEPNWWTKARKNFQVMLRPVLLAPTEFGIWSAWYESKSSGDKLFQIQSKALRDTLERNIALGSADGTFNKNFWQRDPKLINADVTKWVEEAQAEDERLQQPHPPSEEPSFAAPNPNATQFKSGVHGAITVVADPFSPVEGRDLEDLKFHYEEARQLALAAQALGRNMLGQCFDPVEQLLKYTPEEFSAASVNRIHAKVGRLRDRVKLHEMQVVRATADRDLSYILQEEVFVTISSCVEQFNILLAFDPRGRELNALKYGPEARTKAEEINTALQPITLNVGDIGDNNTITIIQGDNNEVKTASKNIHGDQAVVRTAQQNENYAMAILQAGWRIVKAAQDQGISEPTLQFVIAQYGVYGPKILDFIQQFDESFLWLAQHVEAFQILSPIIVLLGTIAMTMRKK